VEGILFAFLGASEILETAKRVGDAEVGLLDAGEHFLVKLFLEGLGGLEDGVGVGIFRVQVSDNFGGFPFREARRSCRRGDRRVRRFRPRFVWRQARRQIALRPEPKWSRYSSSLGGAPRRTRPKVGGRKKGGGRCSYTSGESELRQTAA